MPAEDGRGGARVASRLRGRVAVVHRHRDRRVGLGDADDARDLATPAADAMVSALARAASTAISRASVSAAVWSWSRNVMLLTSVAPAPVAASMTGPVLAEVADRHGDVVGGRVADQPVGGGVVVVDRATGERRGLDVLVLDAQGLDGRDDRVHDVRGVRGRIARGVALDGDTHRDVRHVGLDRDAARAADAERVLGLRARILGGDRRQRGAGEQRPQQACGDATREPAGPWRVGMGWTWGLL